MSTQAAASDVCSMVEHIISPRDKDLGGFTVRRILPYAKQRMVGPWIFFDHLGPADFAAGKGIDVRPHPHINLATVTYLFEGELLHRDSVGSHQLIHPGDINLMVAGKGIVHSERERDITQHNERRIHALQLWHALPEKDEEIDPAFYHYPSHDIPTVDVNDIPIRVMMGEAYGVTSPVKIFANTLYLEAKLNKGQTLTLPNAPERAVYIVAGGTSIGSSTINAHEMAILKQTADCSLTATQDNTRISLIGGEPLGERHIFWNFVSSRKERIEQAKRDWQEGRFPKVPGDEEEFIPLPD